MQMLEYEYMHSNYDGGWMRVDGHQLKRGLIVIFYLNVNNSVFNCKVHHL